MSDCRRNLKKSLNGVQECFYCTCREHCWAAQAALSEWMSMNITCGVHSLWMPLDGGNIQRFIALCNYTRQVFVFLLCVVRPSNGDMFSEIPHKLCNHVLHVCTFSTWKQRADYGHSTPPRFQLLSFPRQWEVWLCWSREHAGGWWPFLRTACPPPMVSGTRWSQPEELLNDPSPLMNARRRYCNWSWMTHICPEPRRNIAEHTHSMCTHSMRTHTMRTQSMCTSSESELIGWNMQTYVLSRFIWVLLHAEFLLSLFSLVIFLAKLLLFDLSEEICIF